MTESEANQLFIVFSRIGTITILIPILTAIGQRKYLNPPLKTFLWYLIFALGINLLEQAFVWIATKYFMLLQPYLKYWEISDTNFLLILFYINDYVFIGLFFYSLLGYKPGIGIWWTAMLLLAASIVNYLFIEGYKTVGFFNPIADAVFVFSVAAFYLWYLYKSHLVLPLPKNPYFWISFGLILPHSIGFFLFLVGDVAQRDNFPLFVSLSIAKNCFLILAQIFYAIAFWRAPYARFVPLPSEEKTT